MKFPHHPVNCQKIELLMGTDKTVFTPCTLPTPTTWGMLMWLAANVCELRAGQWDAVMLCQEMQGVIMDTDEMQHAGCRNYACDLSW